MLKYVFLSRKIIFEMFSRKPLSVPCMPVSVLVALGLSLAWAGVTHGHQGQAQPRAHTHSLPEQREFTAPIIPELLPSSRVSAKHTALTTRNTDPGGCPGFQKAGGSPQCSREVSGEALCSWLPTVRGAGLSRVSSTAQSQTRFCTL